MKTYEEKYKKALEKAKSMMTLPTDKAMIEEIFPELKESEDERIRKGIICGMYALKDQRKTYFASIPIDNVIAWLEKQGEQKTADTDNKFIKMRETKPKDISEFLDRLTTVEQEFLWEHIEKVKKIDREEREQKPAWSEEDIELLDNTIKFIEDSVAATPPSLRTYSPTLTGKEIPFLKALKDKVQPKQKWSEEDEKELDKVIYMMEQLDLTKSWSDCYTFLKSLKDRVHPQPKQEWSEEDENYKDALISLINEIKNQPLCRLEDWDCYLNWLKSLKDRVQPQQEWSEEDEDILNTIINHFKVDIECTDEDDIVRWLKSIKERVQPKQEWSEEDESRRKKVIHILSLDGRIKNEELSDINNWLKSLRPQNRWKPSDEQMNALSVAVKHGQTDDPDALKKLLEQLKKLREE